MSETTAPYVMAALFCENALEERDGALSLIRIVDRVTITASGGDPPSSMPPFSAPNWLVMVLRPGECSGEANITVTLLLPSGKEGSVLTLPVHFEQGISAVNVRARLNIRFEEEGVHWFVVRIEDEEVARLHLEVVYSRSVTPAPAE